MSTIELKSKNREITGAQTPREFLDLLIDGTSLSAVVEGDFATSLGWFIPEENEKAIGRLLLNEIADFPNNRRSIYVCPECGDLGCGAISVVIEKNGNLIIWRDFGYENNYDDEVLLDAYKEIGPFSFDINEHTKAVQ